ncbi:MAG TPA: HU family DNA-binding protein [Blastococcus sp.]|nr:HU family DNA-binding protein [Blastococcus sp.]
MNKSELIAKMTERLSGDRATAAAAVNGVLEEIEGSVARGERVSLTGFGTFERRERAARIGRNPRTGESVPVGPSVVPVFRAGSGFKSLLTRTGASSITSGSETVEGSVARSKGKNAQAAPSASAASSVVVDADAEAPEKKAGKKSRAQAGKKSSKGSHKPDKGKGKAGKKAGKVSR